MTDTREDSQDKDNNRHKEEPEERKMINGKKAGHILMVDV
jgi:hypothetical protein